METKKIILKLRTERGMSQDELANKVMVTRQAGLMVLELLAKSGTKVYYAGDLDPEGILIAQKLSRYYKGEFHYWHMETEDYEKCKSEEVISPKRMKILERITDDRLKPVVERIKAYGTAGYQEMLVEERK